MSWDILPKANLQYFLSKLKDKLDLKVDKENGKVLSDNNYTTTEKNKLAGIASGAEQNVQTDWNQSDNTADDYLKNKPSVPEDLNDLDDVNISSPSNNDVLKYNSTSQKWENGTGGSGNGYSPDDTAETMLVDDDKIPFYDTSASGRRNSTWSNIKAKLKAYFDTLYGTVTGVKGNSESSYRTGNVNLTPGNIGAVNKTGDTMSGRLTFTKTFNQILTGTGTAGSESSGTYYPAKWTFNTGLTATNGDIITIKIPVAGYSKGEYLSIDNGATYHPVAIYGTSRLNTQFAIDMYITLVFDANASITAYNINGSTASSTVTGGAWRVINYYDTNDNTVPSAYCTTAAGTAAKTATCTNFKLLANSYLHILVYNANTSASALTLNVNSTGAKPIYINGSASSSSNYTLPAGTYLVFYNGTNYYFRTDGKLTADITGSATTASSCTGNAATATKATQDSDGNAINTTYMKKGVDRVTAGKTASSTVGANATAEGSEVYALANCGHAEGLGTQAGSDGNAIASHAEGNQTKAFLNGSHSEGIITTAYGSGAHSEGYATSAQGNNSHAEGESTTAIGNDSHAEGYKTTASGIASHAEGGYRNSTYYSGTLALGISSHSEGSGTTANGDYSHSEGYGTSAYAYGSHTEGGFTHSNGDYSHSEGYCTTAIGNYSHSEGFLTSASGNNSHAEGSGYTYTSASRTYYKYTIASGTSSHAEGYATTASGNYSHAQGYASLALHTRSSAAGYGTKTGANDQFVIGRCNVGKSDTIFEIGNGENAGSPKNVFEVTANGVRSFLISSQTLTLTINGSSQTFYLYLFSNGVKCIHIASSNMPTAAYNGTGVIPEAYRPASDGNADPYFSGFNAQYNNTAANISKTRFGAIGANGNLWIYGSAYVGFFMTYYYV